MRTTIQPVSSAHFSASPAPAAGPHAHVHAAAALATDDADLARAAEAGGEVGLQLSARRVGGDVFGGDQLRIEFTALQRGQRDMALQGRLIFEALDEVGQAFNELLAARLGDGGAAFAGEEPEADELRRREAGEQEQGHPGIKAARQGAQVQAHASRPSTVQART